MKTSKRLLSFFLAVVMVVTTCSVGLTAFAADDPEDQVFTYITDDGEAVDITYQGLQDIVNTYAPDLIESLRGELEGIEGANIDVDKIVDAENPIGELLGQLAPFLYGVLNDSAYDTLAPMVSGGITGMGNTAESVLGSAYDSSADYSYLEDEDATLSFWDLYSVVSAVMNDESADKGGAFYKFCKDAKPKLDSLLNAYDSAYSATAKVDEVMRSVLDTTAFAPISPLMGINSYAILFNNSDNPDFVAASNAIKSAGYYAGVPASAENIGDVLLSDGKTTLKQWTDEVQADGNKYKDYDFTPFINYVSRYAQLSYIINEGETLSLLNSLFYYYNLSICSSSVSLTYMLLSHSNKSYTFSQAGMCSGLGLDSQITVRVEPGEYWYNLTVNAESDAYTWELFKNEFMQTMAMQMMFGTITPSVLENAKDELYGLYMCIGTMYLPMFSEGSTVSDDVSTFKTEWYKDTLSGLFAVTGKEESFEAARALIDDSYAFDADELNVLRRIAEKYNFFSGYSPDDFNKSEFLGIKANFMADVYAAADEIGDDALVCLLDYTDSRSYANSFIQVLRSWDGGDVNAFISNNLAAQQFADQIQQRYGAYLIHTYFSDGFDSGENGNYKNYLKPALDSYVISASLESYEQDDFVKAQEVAEGETPAWTVTDIWTGVVNTVLNSLVNGLLDPDAGGIIGGQNINDLLSAFVQSDVDFIGLLNNIYLNLADNPVQAIFRLLPALVVLIDELIVPIAFNQEGDSDPGNLLNVIINIIAPDATQGKGSPTGIGRLQLDLNTIVPTLLHWLLRDNDYTYTYYNEVTDNGDGTYTYNGTYTAQGIQDAVPCILNIYVADQALGNASISGIAEPGNAIVKELATFGLEVVEEYIAEHGNDAKGYDAKGKPLNRGLNNILVAFPAIINDLGQKMMEKYNIPSDWSFGEFDTFEDEASGNTITYNVTVQQYKDLAAKIDSETAKNVLGVFVEMFVDNWFNAIIDLLNDVVSTDNDITNNLPIVKSLFDALDLFGEESVLTDVFNGLFLITRDHPNSFVFEEHDPNDPDYPQTAEPAEDAPVYVGISKTNAYFLLANLDTIVTIVMNIVEANKTEETPDDTTDDTTGDADSGEDLISIILDAAMNSLQNNAQTISSDKDNLEGASSLISTLDSVLSSLLSNAYMNGYQLDQVDGILSGVVTFLTNAFGENEADEVWYLVTDYLKAINAASANEAGTANANADGPIDRDEVYTAENLSSIITRTYVLLEDVLEDKLVVKGDEHKLINSALNGLYSPSAVYIHAQDTIDEGIQEYLTWNDISGTSFASDLGYSFKDGDKEAFYENFVESLSVIPAILGVLLVDAGLYENTLAPILGAIAEPMGAQVPEIADDATGAEATLAVIESFSNILGSFLNAPVSGLLGLVRGVVTIAGDSFLNEVKDNTLAPIIGELNGLAEVARIFDPASGLDTLITTELVDQLEELVNGYIPRSNVLGTLLGKLGVEGVSGNTFNDVINLVNRFSGSNEQLLLMIYTVAADLLTDENIFSQLVGNQYPWLTELVTKYDSATLLKLISDLVGSLGSTKELQWIVDANKKDSGFTYPTGITAQDANDAVDQLDELVANIFPLLQQFGLLDESNLSSLLNGFIFTNSNITELAKAVYGAIENAAGDSFKFTPSQLASYLMDSSYGATFSSAASTLRKCDSWSKVGNVNWGFTDGSSSAQTGFVKALAALTRPVNDILAAFLAGGDANLAAIAADVLGNLNINTTTTSGDWELKIVLQSNVLILTARNTANPNSVANEVKVDLTPVLSALNALVIGGTNGYESAVKPILEALNISCKSYDEYLKDYAKAKDNLLINILNPIVDFLNDVTAAPFDTLTAALPKLAAFLNNNGLGKALNNLLAPVTDLIKVLGDNGIDINALVEELAGAPLKDLLEDAIGIDLGNLKLDLTDISGSLNVQDILIPLVNSLLKDNGINIKLADIDWAKLAALTDQGQVLITVLRYIESTLITNAAAISDLLGGIEALSSNATIKSILDSVFGQIATASKDDIVRAVFYLLLCQPTNVFFDYTGFEYKDYEFTYPTTVDMEFLTILGPMLDGLIGGLIEGGLTGLVAQNVYTDNIVSTIATGLYGAVEGVKIDDSMNLTELLAMTDIDFSTDAVADLLENKDYGQTYSAAAKTIRNAGSWARVNADSLSWGVKDRDTFVHALVAVLRPIYGVLDVLLNDGALGLFNLIYLPGSDGYTSTIVPLLEALGCYNIKTQYQYRQDMSKEYDYILIDILNPLLDKVEDLLNAPIQTLADMLPNLALFFANDGLLQIIENLLTPIRALLDAVKPIADVNDILSAAGLNISKELQKLGIVGSDYSFDIYDLSGSLKPLIGKDNIVSLLNTVLGMIEVNGAPLGLELMPIDWYKLASHGEVITNEASQASTHGGRIYVDADPNEVLIAVLRYLVETINYKDNYTTISNLIGGLIGGADDSISGVVNNVLSVVVGETDEVINELCGILEILA